MKNITGWDWIQSKLKDNNDKSIVKWDGGKFHPGKIYIFKYDALHKDTLSYWDRHPIIIFLGYIKSDDHILAVGLNVSWWPPNARKWIMTKILKFHAPTIRQFVKNRPLNAIQQMPLLIDLDYLKSAFDKYGLSFAYRTYIVDRIKSPVICLSYECWTKAEALDIPNVFPELKSNDGYNLKEIYNLFKEHVKNQQKNSSKMSENRQIAKKAGKFKLIKS